MTKITITDKEMAMLKAILNNEYYNGEAPTVENRVGGENGQWTPNPFNNKKTCGGVCASLSKKGLAGFDDFNGQDTPIAWLTQAGFDIVMPKQVELPETIEFEVDETDPDLGRVFKETSFTKKFR